MINDNPNLPNFITREQEDKWKQKGPKKKKQRLEQRVNNEALSPKP